MKRLLAFAALLLASNAAQAQYTIDYGGKTIRIDPDRGTVSIPGVFDNTGAKKPKRAKHDQDAARKPATQPPSATDPAPPAADAAPTTAAPPTANTQPAPATAGSPAATSSPAVPAPPSTSIPLPPPRPPQAPGSAPAAALAAAPATAPAPAAAPTPAPARDPSSPIGVWLTEEKEGKIRIEPCGANLCGYAVDEKSNENREQILINMRPGADKKWTGRIFDPDSGSTYDSTIALKGPDALRVQGCALGGMFCGGQTWTRVN
ncbi:DUF2147 domain-containing protein [Bradyrhizobium sp. STM 3843]|uniref:DUF2147 domain-containing protein n=1 Tax=Bradyrhizobium sp. STM 3843 TaxID=551947 RepID=UPI0002E9BB5D|nr:DUF2147 domain-containing protein [Bradyrhizobium sp. STM 3843]